MFAGCSARLALVDGGLAARLLIWLADVWSPTTAVVVVSVWAARALRSGTSRRPRPIAGSFETRRNRLGFECLGRSMMQSLLAEGKGDEVGPSGDDKRGDDRGEEDVCLVSLCLVVSRCWG